MFCTSPRTSLVPTKLDLDIFTMIHCSEHMLGKSRVNWNVTDMGKCDWVGGIVTQELVHEDAPHWGYGGVTFEKCMV